MIKDVYVVFKTHLDIGFTDLAENVSKQYLNVFIPNAIKRGYELKDTDTPYIWSVGSWAINEALKYDEDGSVKKAIEDGVIKWHGLPFTTFTETMSKELFDYALSISTKLDARFNKKTIAAKMSDVPGHTKAMIKPLAEHGIEFVHIGTNIAYPIPDVPPVFRWSDGENEIIMMYQNDYGATTEFDDFVITFGFTFDNTGPQSAEDIKKLYKELREKYPDANVRAATLDDVAMRLRGIKETLPVVTTEIGDLWIYNAGTDPKKVSLYRELLRHIEKNGISGDLSNNLLCVPEHTWGGCIHMFGNYDAYYLEDFSNVSGDSKAKIERTWEEQREYIDKAQKVLGTNYQYDVSVPDLSEYNEIEIPELPFELSWQLLDNENYKRFFETVIKPSMWDIPWVSLDNAKYNLPDYKGGYYHAIPKKAYSNNKNTIVKLEFDSETATKQGLPYFYAIFDETNFEIRWFGQKATRLPNAYWLKFVGYHENWEISKLGQWINAAEPISNPFLSATDKGIRNGEVEIESLDAILVAPYGRYALNEYKNPQKQDMYFNLYNNVWGCNHPMWYSDDSKFRFKIKKLK